MVDGDEPGAEDRMVRLGEAWDRVMDDFGFRGHVRRNEIGPVYWTTCRVTACEPGREFGFAVLAGDRPVNNWHYRLTPAGDGTDVTESYRLNQSAAMRVFWLFAGHLRGRRNLRDMRTTLERIKKVVEED